MRTTTVGVGWRDVCATRKVILAALTLSLALTGCSDLPAPADEGAAKAPEFETSAQALASGDAYINYDSATGTWSIGTAKIEKKVRLASGQFKNTSLLNKAISPAVEMIQTAAQGIEFAITAGGVSYSGTTPGWTLYSQSITLGSLNEVKLDLALNDTGNRLRVGLHYSVYPSTGVIEQWVEYTNLTTGAVQVYDPEMLDTQVFANDYASGALRFTYAHGTRNFCDPPRPNPFDNLADNRMNTQSLGATVPIDLGNDNYSADNFLPEVVLWKDAVTDYGVLIGWSHSSGWYLKYRSDGRFQLDAHTVNGMSLPAGGNWQLPIVHIMAFAGPYDFDSAGNDLKDFQYRYKYEYFKSKFNTPVKPYIITGPTGYTTDVMFRASQAFRHVGADIFHVDEGWHDVKGTWNDATPASLPAMTALNRANNMETMFHLAIYEAAVGSEVANLGYTYPTGLWEWVNVNFTNASAVTWMKNKLNAKKTQWGDYIWRQDWPRRAWGGANGINPLVARKNYFQLMKDFRTANPNSGINVNQCGGYQMSVETLRYSDLVQTTDGQQQQHSIYTNTYFYPPDKLWGLHLPNGSVENMHWSATTAELRGALGAAWQWDGWGTPTLAQQEAFRKNADIYHFMGAKGIAGRYSQMWHPAVSNDPRPEAHSYYLQRLSSDRTKGAIIAMSGAAPASGLVTVYPRNLLPTTPYTVRLAMPDGTNFVATSQTGSYWMTNGIGVPNWSGVIAWIGVTNYPGAGTDTTLPTAPTSPAKVSATYMSKAGVKITWAGGTDNNWVSYFDIERLDGTSWVLAGRSPTVKFYFDPAESGGSLSKSYRIRTVDGDGNASAWVSL
jgi:hypothetical protein